MNDEDTKKLATYRWMKSRIPAVDAISVFVPDNLEHPAELTRARTAVGRSRWFPVNGGHKVLIPIELDDYDTSYFAVEPGGWDHEHCDLCSSNIPAMTLCYVTMPGEDHVLLCAECFDREVGPTGLTRT